MKKIILAASFALATLAFCLSGCGEYHSGPRYAPIHPGFRPMPPIHRPGPMMPPPHFGPRPMSRH